MKELVVFAAKGRFIAAVELHVLCVSFGTFLSPKNGYLILVSGDVLVFSQFYYLGDECRLGLGALALSL